MRIRGVSFHSVKGGVGKSSLATMAALQCARANPARPVYLIDMDLTGTSLADVLDLRAPRWDGDPPITRPLLEKTEPTDFHTLDDSRLRIDQRNNELRDRNRAPDNWYAPFLNDFLLHEPTDEARECDVCLKAIFWRFADAPENLRVIPSSATPGDLDRIIPVIFDEHHAALLEARLETLLGKLVEYNAGQDISVIVDVPPTIPGLSRSVMSLGLRLSREKKQPLAAKGDVVPVLRDTEVDWTIHLVTSPDPQDLRATERWLALVLDDEKPRFRVVINRHDWAKGEESIRLADALGLLTSGDPTSADPMKALGRFEPYIDDALFVADDKEIEFFRRRSLPAKTIDFGRLI
jgi:hypothetical protein